jgi:triacylglycerol esterase/lipase EstA (alpha/beta hydrolase family)
MVKKIFFYKTIAVIFFVFCFSTVSFSDDKHLYPLILIPGLTATPVYMEVMKTNFVNAGWDQDMVIIWTDSNHMEQDLTVAAAELGTKIDSVLSQTRAKKVILITWSMSTLASRYLLKNNTSYQKKVAMYFSLAGPQHGSNNWSMCTPSYPSCLQMNPNSDFLRNLNKDTEVPGSPKIVYTTYVSKCDTNLIPPESGRLNGADNRVPPTCITHYGMVTDSFLFSEIKNLIIEYKGDQK